MGNSESYRPWIGNLVVQGVLGNYGTVKRACDEGLAPASRGELRVEVQVARQAVAEGDFEVEVFTNLNRRAFARPFEPLANSNGPDSYWVSHPLAYLRAEHDNLVFGTTLPVERCGAYRLTARYRRRGSDGWWWHNDFTPAPGLGLQRDCAILLFPPAAARLAIYEANALTVEALSGGDYQNRSTLDDFLPGADFDDFNPFDLSYVRDTLGFNALWLMPIYPSTRWRWSPEAGTWVDNRNPGSPYATRDYFSVNPWLADDDTGARALELFQQVVGQASDTGLRVLIDVAFNHAGRDVRYGEGAVELGLCQPSEASEWLREVRTRWCTRGSEFPSGRVIPHYREAADNGYACALHAPADRLGEHQWLDANVDWFFGDYSCLGPKLGTAQQFGLWDAAGHAEDERDLFYTDLATSTETAQLWHYFAHILPFWLRQTDNKLGGIRADFAQGLPNRLWEYIVNVTRNARWDFVFLAEVLDPPPIQYRLNKVFDLLTTLSHFTFRDDSATMGQLFGILEGEAQLLGPSALVLHNGTSHDEQGNRNKWVMVARYAVAAAVYGVPMVFMSQPLGIPHKLDFEASFANMYQEWTAADPERTAVAAMYRRINLAREAAAELTGGARYFLSLSSGGFHGRIFSVARWVAAGDRDSVVLVFVNLSPSATFEATFAIPRSIRLVGRYQASNLAADDPTATLWPSPLGADELYERGVYVRFSFPNEVQYLRLAAA